MIWISVVDNIYHENQMTTTTLAIGDGTMHSK